MKNGFLTKAALRSLLCLLMLCAGCCIDIGCWPRAKYKRTDTLQAPLEAGSTVVAETSFGSITVTGADVTECNVTAKICVQAPTEKEAAEIAEKVKVKLVPTGKTLTVKVEKPRVGNNRSIGVSFDITVPKQTDIECSTSYGSIKLANIKGTVKAETSFASIDCEDIQGAAQLETSYGRITCRNITSTSLKAETSFSSIKCEHVQGPVHLETSYGSINCRDITSSDLTARSSFGGIDIVCSPSTPPEINANVVTSYGNIDFSAPPEFSGEIDLSTSYGSIKTDLPILVKGDLSKEKIKGIIGDGKGKLRLKTSFGSIKIK